jgi:hypothetical protein
MEESKCYSVEELDESVSEQQTYFLNSSLMSHHSQNKKRKNSDQHEKSIIQNLSVMQGVSVTDESNKIEGRLFKIDDFLLSAIGVGVIFDIHDMATDKFTDYTKIID